MKRKIVSWLLVGSLSLYIGCYNTEMVSKEGLKPRVEQYDITVSTKDSLEYIFLKDNYRVQGDTLTGFGVRRSNRRSDIVLDASLPFADITSIETKEFSFGKTLLLCAGIGLGAAFIIKILFTHDQPLMVTPVTF
jgi:hypothetical protein